MKTLLLTGFEPFLGHPINPTEQIVKELDGKETGDYQIKGKLLPVDFAEAQGQFVSYMNDLQHDAVISLGLAAGRECITPERVAINIRDGEPDNKGNAHQDALIEENGPAAYFSTLPIRAMVEELNAAGLPAKISNTAGTYLCNNIMYSMLHELESRNMTVPAGFIHVPASHDLVVKGSRAMPSWSQADLTKAIEIMIGVLAGP
ncbi:pyroglutamyl-peptidase I [Falsibacillus albus]|uniref:Pyrrolidone-carboxylate peptidase n=1 Tax=Falsibacillus albus TaxID=2478915 RepID=A0A3L7JVJ6_9BACI|nr:pyroglutamyl-peptidase I [Falsibacillus albus]RLQ94753.1 pyroglutamyl-peptidase I [Falsibacillus albus]